MQLAMETTSRARRRRTSASSRRTWRPRTANHGASATVGGGGAREEPPVALADLLGEPVLPGRRDRRDSPSTKPRFHQSRSGRARTAAASRPAADARRALDRRREPPPGTFAFLASRTSPSEPALVAPRPVAVEITAQAAGAEDLPRRQAPREGHFRASSSDLRRRGGSRCAPGTQSATASPAGERHAARHRARADHASRDLEETGTPNAAMLSERTATPYSWRHSSSCARAFRAPLPLLGAVGRARQSQLFAASTFSTRTAKIQARVPVNASPRARARGCAFFVRSRAFALNRKEALEQQDRFFVYSLALAGQARRCCVQRQRFAE